MKVIFAKINGNLSDGGLQILVDDVDEGQARTAAAAEEPTDFGASPVGVPVQRRLHVLNPTVDQKNWNKLNNK